MIIQVSIIFIINILKLIVENKRSNFLAIYVAIDQPTKYNYIHTHWLTCSLSLVCCPIYLGFITIEF